MMLQGHFVHTLLAPEYHDPENRLYAWWSFMRGLTAPVFFFASGLVFVFLLLKDPRPWRQNQRVQKGIIRAGQLLLIGYLLRLNVIGLFDFRINNSFWAVDVLHCIGLALLTLIGIYFLAQRTKSLYPFYLLVTALVIFYFTPSLGKLDWAAWPRPLANYFTRDFGSVFTPVPWVGYALLGGVLGALLNRFPNLAFRWWFPIPLAILGYALHAYSSPWLVDLYRWTNWPNLPLIYNNNYLFIRLGHVFIALAVFSSIALIFKRIPPLILRIGSETLLIYEVHYFVLYGSWFGLGLAKWQRGSLDPATTAVGAVLFVGLFVWMIARLDRLAPWLQEGVLGVLRFSYRFARIKLVRSYYWLAYRNN